MKSTISSGFRQAANIGMFLVPLLTAGVIMLNFMNPLIRAYRVNSVIEGLHINLMIQALQSDSLISFLPILAALPFGGCFVDDLKSKFARFFLIRSSYRTYIVSRIIVGFLTGGLAILSGALITWGTTAAVLSPMEREIEGMEPAGIDSLIQICFLLFLNGGLWAVIGMTMSTLMESKYIAYCSPFVIYYLLVILCERYFPDAFLLYPPNWVKPDLWPYGVWGAGIFLAEVTVLFGLLFVFRAGRRLREL